MIMGGLVFTLFYGGLEAHYVTRLGLQVNAIISSLRIDFKTVVTSVSIIVYSIRASKNHVKQRRFTKAKLSAFCYHK